MRQPLTERYRERLAGVLSCYDRIIVTGTLPGACYAINGLMAEGGSAARSLNRRLISPSGKTAYISLPSACQ